MAVICPKCGRQYDVVLFDFRSYLVCECGYKISKDDLHRCYLKEVKKADIYVIIPARYAAKRFPGKPLALWQGRPLIQHVYASACKSSLPRAIVVATDDERIAEAVRAFGGKVVMTAKDHPSGTDRLAEAANLLGLKAQDIIVNVQGDMPHFHPEIIAEVSRPLLENPLLPMSTLAQKITLKEEITDPNCVKVVFTPTGKALYFSRAPIPYDRDKKGITYYKHLGIYGYRKVFLDKFVKLEQTPLEKIEKLEQLRALEHGYPIFVAETKHTAIDVNVPEDLEKLEKMMGERK